MKVYLLTRRCCAGDEFIVGVYANLESAKIDAFNQSDDKYLTFNISGSGYWIAKNEMDDYFIEEIEVLDFMQEKP